MPIVILLYSHLASHVTINCLVVNFFNNFKGISRTGSEHPTARISSTKNQCTFLKKIKTQNRFNKMGLKYFFHSSFNLMYFSPMLHNPGYWFHIALSVVHLKHIFEVNQIFHQRFIFSYSVQKLLRKLQVDVGT